MSRWIPTLTLLFVALFLLSMCVSWRWDECRKVGHSGAYCLWDITMGRD